MKNTATIPLVKTELDHLLTLLRDESRRGDYYGNREQHYRRRDRLFQRLSQAYMKLTGKDGYPLKPSIWNNVYDEESHDRPARTNLRRMTPERTD